MCDVIGGGGLAGLAAGCEPANTALPTSSWSDSMPPGGLRRTIDFGGRKFDLGPHRCFTKSGEVRRVFLDVVGDDVLRV